MLWNSSLLPAGSPFVAHRRNFERPEVVAQLPVFAAMAAVEHSDHWTVSVDLPGLSEQDINVTFNDGMLIIEGERQAPPVDGGKELFNDRSFSRFRRVLKFREPIDQGAIEASLADGVLTLTLRRTPESIPTRVTVRSASA